MRKFVSALMSLAFLAAIGAGPVGAATDSNTMTHGTMTHGTMMKSKCGPGMTRVHGYTNKMTGKHVKGYCRKSAMMMHKKM